MNDNPSPAREDDREIFEMRTSCQWSAVDPGQRALSHRLGASVMESIKGSVAENRIPG